MNDDNATIEKIKKLFALASNAGATENEAAVALKMANKLMMEHGIVAAHLSEKPKIGSGTLNAGMDEAWHGFLANAVGNLHSVKAVRSGRTQELFFMGRLTNVETANLTLAFLASQVEALYKINLPKGLTVSARAEYRRSFKRSCALRVCVRIEQIIKQQVASDALALEYTGSTALVVIDHRNQLMNEAEQVASGAGVRQGRKVALRMGGNGSGAGYAAGDQVKINERLK